MKRFVNKFKIFGGRVFKTGLAVFITAYICELLSLPAIFAVITAIVTIEPTAAESIKKGVVRFPASAIGAAFSLTFTAFIGEDPLSYALAATSTILLCHRLKLDDGILVATLTAVAMIPVTGDNFILAFFTRLLTTSIGLFVSTLVNLIILPPKFSPIIHKSIDKLFIETAQTIEVIGHDILGLTNTKKTQTVQQFQAITKSYEKTLQLCHYQRAEWKFHRHTTKEMRDFQIEHKKLTLLQQILFHIGNLQHLSNYSIVTNIDKEKLHQAFISINTILKDPKHRISDDHYDLIKDLDENFRKCKEQIGETHTKYYHHFPKETVLLFELLSIHDVLEEVEHLTRNQSKRDKEYTSINSNKSPE
ncbi:aromatic acid exporter family protein [Bacillus sp. SM2101]|uniref:FUSC family protein n=1 Tax=Bacillus sp. SM2101 TaxID=2805366 RepID=UPI001BDE1203|nr:aromatic acid exporter family protein [Bacillus sp. SM2101]